MGRITDSERRFLGSCKSFLVDLDGTMYLDNELLPGALAFLEQLERLGLPHIFLTNNSSKSSEHYRMRLQRLGVSTHSEQILTSGDATIDYILSRTPHKSAYLVGTESLASDFEAAGIALSSPDPDCVVLGFDTAVNYTKIERACTLLFAGKPYYATHPDRTCITQRGLVPDIAAIIAACEAVTRRTPKIIGKPFPEMVRSALKRVGGQAQSTVIIGDQLDTDMKMAQDSNLLSILLLSGETTSEKLSLHHPNQLPDMILPNISALTALLTQVNESQGT